MKSDDECMIDVDFTGRTKDVTFKTPDGDVKHIQSVKKVLLNKITGDSLELKIIYKEDKSIIYHYINEHIMLLDYFTIE